MRENPLIPAILDILRDADAPLSEFELIQELKKHPCYPVLTVDSRLALFKIHFLVMNALYQLQQSLWDEGWMLRISALSISLERRNAGPSRGGVPGVMESAELLRYYLDWDNYDQTELADVEMMLNRFWEAYLARERSGDALAVLGLDAGADWDDIQARYRELAAECHPDRGGDAKQFIAIRDAYECLKRVYKGKGKNRRLRGVG